MRTLRRILHRPAAVLAFAAVAVVGCSDLISTEPPTGYDASTPDPDAFDNEAGAFELYKGAVTKFRQATSGRTASGGYIVNSGLLADELGAGETGGAALSAKTSVDSRVMSSSDPSSAARGYTNAWRELHGVRMQSMTAMSALRTYGESHPQDLTGHLFALWGMAEVMLANFFCSGIPLTTVDYDGAFDYAPGSTTAEVYEHAVALFDSAHANAPDSTNFRHLASVGKGWALLNLGRFDEAAQAVANVPTSWTYLNLHEAIDNSIGTQNFTSAISSTSDHKVGDMGTVSDVEGGTGLPYRSSGDPRTMSPKMADAQATAGEMTVYKPGRWLIDGAATPVVMASGVEARLIEAEAALRAGGAAWLNTLNDLRTTGDFTEEPDPDDPAATDTIWAPGDGAVLFTAVGGSLPGLEPLDDPGTDAGRVDMLFRERAYWLFVTGRRQADMRRLIRQYGRLHTDVFPQGGYPAGPIGTYGVDVNAPVPASEILFNPEYEGCFDRQA